MENVVYISEVLKKEENMEDKEIVQLYWNRDTLAIKETAYKYGNYCESIARNILYDNEDVEECVLGLRFAIWFYCGYIIEGCFSANTVSNTNHPYFC